MTQDRQLQEIEHWAKQMSWELLGQPVSVSFVQGRLGRTQTGGKQQMIEIEISSVPVFAGHPHGMDITRGLVLHELGHHLVDIGIRGFRQMRSIARAEGVASLYDILCDERLERRLRSRRPSWGVYFDRLASYAFSQKRHEVSLDDYAALLQFPVEHIFATVQGGAVPGQLVIPPQAGLSPTVILRDADLLVLPGVTPLLTAFLACLRCGMDPYRHPDPRVAEALAWTPRHLKDLSHAEVLQAAREIAAILGHDEDQRSEEQQLQRRLQASPNALRGLADMLHRMEQTNRIPRQWREVDSRRSRVRRDGSAQGVATPNSPNLNPDEDFPPLTREETLPDNPTQHAEIVRSIALHIRRLRNDLARLGVSGVEEGASRRGRRIDLVQARKSGSRPTPNLFMSSREEQRANAYIGIIIDRSDSMAGHGLTLAKAFSVLVTESAKGVNGIEGHVNAFNDDTWTWLGNFQTNTIASLTTSGSNNDAGALARAAQLALRSRKRHKLLVMISDATPSACTFASLQKLVARLTHDHGLYCAQVAVAEIEHVAFPHYLDVSRLTMNDAVARFGALLLKLIPH